MHDADGVDTAITVITEIVIVIGLVVGSIWLVASNVKNGNGFRLLPPKGPGTGVDSHVKCPACQGASISRVKIGQRAASGVAGGLLFGRAARAQFRCSRCGYLF